MRYFHILLFFVFLLALACKDNSIDSAIVKKDTFDRKVMLQNFAENLIIPAFSSLENETTKLEEAINQLATNKSDQNLVIAQQAWETTYSVWMAANAYNFGPAGEDGIRKGLIEEIGTFPISENKIETIVEKNTANFNDFNRDARGLLAIEYLLFDHKGNSAVISKLQANRLAYLKALIADTKTRVSTINTNWKTYKTEFVSNAGTDVGSSTSQLYNEFVRSFESIKNFKLGLPMGLRAGQTKAEPTKLEAYYSSKSLKFMRLHIENIEKIWLGKGTKEGIGFKAYLETVEGGKALVSSTELQLVSIKKSLEEVPTNKTVENQILTDASKLTILHTELQKNTRFFKSDMSSILGIAITFASGDGD